MPVRSDASKSLEKVRLDFGTDGDLNLVVDRDKFTKGFQRSVEKLNADGKTVEALDKTLEVIVEWDMIGSNGKVLPLTPEGTDELSLRTIGTILTGITEALSPNSETSNS